MTSTSGVLIALLSAMLCIRLAHASTRDLQAASIIENVQVPYNAQVVGTDPLGQLSFSDPRLQRTVTGLEPEQVKPTVCYSAAVSMQQLQSLSLCSSGCSQPVLVLLRQQAAVHIILMLQIHLTYLSDTKMIVSWATGYGNTTISPVDPNYFHEESGPSSTVKWGTTSGQYTNSLTADAFTITYYNQIYTFANANPNYNYSSPLFHHVVLSNLTPSTQYYYVVGDTTYGQSSELTFTQPPAVGNSTYPFVLGVVADPGLTINTTVTIQHLVDANPQVWTLIGDFS